VNKVLGEASTYAGETEFAVPGGIPWSNVMGWHHVVDGEVVTPFTPNPDFVP
jgi:hypothetical protein